MNSMEDQQGSETKVLSDIHQTLHQAAERLSRTSVVALFDDERDRLTRFTVSSEHLQLDFSKQRLDETTLTTLHKLATEKDMRDAFARLTSGGTCNATEERAALHTLLRGTKAKELPDHYLGISNTLERMKALTNSVHSGHRRGFNGDKFTDVVNIGIGGSDLGPRFICRALKTHRDTIKAHFVANVDPQDLDETLANLNPQTTLFVICSKTFTTEETLTNALRAREWLYAAGATESTVADHVVAVTTNIDTAGQFGVAPEACFPLWDWVGGRYSVWSAIGLSIALNQGWETFAEFLEGGQAMDRHTLENSAQDNLPLTMALLEYWNTKYGRTETHLVLPYSQRLEYLADFLQQLTMESNGKSVTLGGTTISDKTAPVLWGSAGTIGQHSYYQMLHQGNRAFSADIVLPLRNGDVDIDAHRKLAANAMAQSRALMLGRNREAATELALARGQLETMAPHYEMPGNHPHSTIVMPEVNARALGELVAAYEHKTFFLSRLFDLNPFDQWGVELGKEIGRQIRGVLEFNTGWDSLDDSTRFIAKAWLDANNDRTSSKK
jgi:glucose-6-phosphate isomerase